MRALLFVLLGTILGAILGFVLPVGFSLFMAWADDFEPGAGAPTAAAIMLIVTVPIGALMGALFGLRRGTLGSWFASSQSEPRLLGKYLPLSHNKLVALAVLVVFVPKLGISLLVLTVGYYAYQNYYLKPQLGMQLDDSLDKSDMDRV